MRTPSWLFELFARKPPFWTRLPFDLLALFFVAFLDVPMDAGADFELGVRLGFEETPLSFPSCEADFERVAGIDVRRMLYNKPHIFVLAGPASRQTRQTHHPPAGGILKRGGLREGQRRTRGCTIPSSTV